MPRMMRLRAALMLVGMLGFLQACTGNPLISRDIDPAGHMTRQDYLALRDRDDKKPSPAQTQPDADLQPVEAIPPIPEMPLDVQAPGGASVPGMERLVNVAVTENVPLRDVLLELAREAQVNLELDPRIQGGIIFTARNRPFHEVLKRMCALAGLRRVQADNFMRIELDEPYEESYSLNYLSLARKATSETSIATNVFDTNLGNGSGASTTNGTNGTGSLENNSTAKVASASQTDFWSEVEKSLGQILAATDRKGEGKTPASFSLDRQAGLVTVFADSRQQTAIATYLHKLTGKAYAQVLIDARIVEVELDDSFKSGIDWKTLFSGAFRTAAHFVTPTAAATDGLFSASVATKDFNGILNLVQGFGTTRVLSAPRLTVLNNQTAVMKVATNQVYFITQAQFTTVTNANGASVTTTPVYTSTPHTVPVGLVMTVQPAIDAEHDRVTMTLRPTISRVVSTVNDPSIGLNAAQANVANPVQSQIPVLAVREMDSVIQLRSGEVAVLGGLMQDSSLNQENGVPPFDTLPVAGSLFRSRDNAGSTTELVILLRATIADTPAPDDADADLYTRYNHDPRPLPMPKKHVSAKPQVPPPQLPADTPQEGTN